MMQHGNIGMSLCWLAHLELIGQTPAQLQLYDNTNGERIIGEPTTFIIRGTRDNAIQEANKIIHAMFDELEKENLNANSSL